MGHIIIILILFVSSLLIYKTCKLVNSSNSSTCLTCLTEEFLKVFEDRTFGAVITTEVFTFTKFFYGFFLSLA